MLAGVGFDLGPVQRHSPQLHGPRFQRQPQHLLEHLFQRRQVELTKVRDGPEVWLVARRQHPERDVLLQPLLNAPRTEHPYAIAVNQQLRHQLRIIGRLTATFVSVMRVDFGKIQLIDHIAYEVN